MIKLRPIFEPEMISYFNQNRFDGELGGHIAASDEGTIGILLFRQNEDDTEILTIDTDDLEVAEGLLRATIFKTLTLGALTFCDKSGIIWSGSFSLDKNKKYDIEEFFSQECKGGCQNCPQTCKKTN